MDKPYGMTPFLTIVRPTQAQNAIWEAAQEAHMEGMTVEEFRDECREAWAETLRQQAKDDDRAWEDR